MKHKLNIITKNLVLLCDKLGIKYAVLAPGSRSAPIALEFIRNKNIRHFVINDERSAAYIAMGIARQSNTTVALVCTSGTAALNFAPALAEAYNLEIPLLVLTADRPVEWVGQGENQTIIQDHMFAPNILKSFRINISYSDEAAENEAYRIFSEAINQSQFPKKGPVHINIPIREPLYEFDSTMPEKKPKVIEFEYPVNQLTFESQSALLEKILLKKRIMILAGIMHPDKKLATILDKLTSITDTVFIGDVSSNLSGIKRKIKYPEQIISVLNENELEKLTPDLLISIGSFVISKKLREFLRKSNHIEHWHVDPAGKFTDTYLSLQKVIPLNPVEFFRILLRKVKLFEKKTFRGYYKEWEKADHKAITGVDNRREENKELQMISSILENIPGNSILHLGNSMTVRYANETGFGNNKSVKSIDVFSNRGTSGIDGCLSSCAGSSMVSEKIHTIILGDQSLMYDRNALWNNYLGNNLKIIVINNQGGGIFRQMEGPSKQPELDEYFVNFAGNYFKLLAAEHGLEYFECSNLNEIQNTLKKFYSSKSGRTCLLEISMSDQTRKGGA